MKAIQTGNIFRVYDNSLKTYDQLPPKAFLVNFNQQEGFSLSLYSDIEVNERIYGVHAEKVSKVLKSFNLFERNLGVILSGDRGLGKTLFTKMLAKKGMELGFPLVIVNTYFPGIAEYLNNIEQEIIVLFDEFDKTFYNNKDDRHNPQTEMLTLFDGIAQGKKLFVVTCNSLEGLNSFLVNRPGRFHYHFRFDYPNADDIREYLCNALKEKYHKEIEQVVSFSTRVDLNYDCLRSIAFELNTGLSFKEAIADLNIVNLRGISYILYLYLDNGETLRIKEKVDTFSQSETSSEFYDTDDSEDLLFLYYIPSDGSFNIEKGSYIIDGEKLKITLEEHIRQDSSYPNYVKLYEKYKDVKPLYLEFKKEKEDSIHYLV